MAILAVGSLPITWTKVVNKFFIKHRGLAIGATMSGTGLAAFIAPPIVEFWITNYGWRAAYIFLGTSTMIISLPIIFFLFRENNIGASKKSMEASNWGLTRKEAIKSYRFWVLGLGLFATVIAAVGLIPHLPQLLTDLGLSEYKSRLVSIMGLTIILGRFLVGFLVDRFWAPGVASVFFMFPIIGIAIFIFLDVNLGLAIFSVLLIGLALGAELDLLSYLTGRYFGNLHYGAIFGGIYAFFTIATGLASNIYARIRDAHGSYNPMLYAAIILLIFAIICFLSLGKYPHSRKESER